MQLTDRDIDRFESKIIKTPSCWLFQGYRDRNGYCQFRVRENVYRAHRVAYFLFIGNLDPNLPIDHTCEVKNCVNPEHLEQVTVKENTRRGLHFPSDLHCIKGHLLTEDNVYHPPRGGQPVCKTCRRDWDYARRS